MNKHQTSIAAESFAAGVFAQAGYSVFVQYGANQPGFDLVVSNGNKPVQISVKGSTSGGWFLTSKKKDGTYEQSYDQWVQKNKGLVFCFVQFLNTKPGEMPRLYLASGNEVTKELATHYYGELCLELIEHRIRRKGKYKDKVQQLPPEWKMNEQRIAEVLGRWATPSIELQQT